MLPKKATFSLNHRKNIHSKTGTEWVLNVQFDTDKYLSGATICTWKKKPSKITVTKTIQIVSRSIELYYLNIYLPRFQLEIVISDF